MNSILAKAAMPMPRPLLDLLRLDPTDSISELKRRLDQRQPFDLPMRQGMIQDGRHLWLPVQLKFTPADSKITSQLKSALDRICASVTGCGGAFAFGPHFSTLENEQRIREDVAVVSWVGTLAMFVLVLFVLLTGRWRIVLLLPILLVGISLAAVGTILAFGKIHGITLAFGPGIVGLAMDYGVHAVFLNPRHKGTWKSNLAGLLTTLVILLILFFSQIPLLKQLMFFSIFGLILSFGLFYALLHIWPATFETSPYGFTPRTWRAGEWLAQLLLLAAPLIFLKSPDLSIQHLNFESSRTVELREWFAKHTIAAQPYWIEEAEPLESDTRDWAIQNEMAYEGAAISCPRRKCRGRTPFLGKNSAHSRPCFTSPRPKNVFFHPFFERIGCQNPGARDLTHDPPDYLKDFQAQGRWASLLFPLDEGQVARVKEKFPKATTPRELFAEFPKIFIRELSWMVPLALQSHSHFSIFIFEIWATPSCPLCLS